MWFKCFTVLCAMQNQDACMTLDTRKQRNIYTKVHPTVAKVERDTHSAAYQWMNDWEKTRMYNIVIVACMQMFCFDSRLHVHNVRTLSKAHTHTLSFSQQNCNQRDHYNANVTRHTDSVFFAGFVLPSIRL